MKKILIVEDDDNLRGILVNLFSQKNYTVFEAEDGEKAVVLAIDKAPAVMLLDLLLPKLDGFHVLEKVRKHEDPNVANIRVIILSNLWTDKDILQARALKIDEYYVKANTDIHDVAKKVDSIIGIN